jgi:hypothetical protein
MVSIPGPSPALQIGASLTFRSKQSGQVDIGNIVHRRTEIQRSVIGCQMSRDTPSRHPECRVTTHVLQTLEA